MTDTVKTKDESFGESLQMAISKKVNWTDTIFKTVGDIKIGNKKIKSDTEIFISSKEVQENVPWLYHSIMYRTKDDCIKEIKATPETVESIMPQLDIVYNKSAEIKNDIASLEKKYNPNKSADTLARTIALFVLGFVAAFLGITLSKKSSAYGTLMEIISIPFILCAIMNTFRILKPRYSLKDVTPEDKKELLEKYI